MNLREYANQIGVRHGTVKRWAAEGMPVVRDWSFGDMPSVYVVTDLADAWIGQRYPGTIARNRESVVYFMRRPSGDIKIGFTSDPRRRLKEVRKSSKGAQLLGHVPGDKTIELSWHARFERERIPGGEWFKATPALLQSIREASSGTAAHC